MRLNLDFDVVVDGDRLTGHSNARAAAALGGHRCAPKMTTSEDRSEERARTGARGIEA